MKNAVLGILAHVDAGKTTLSESILFHTGVLRKCGRVDMGESALDTNTLEKLRGITIFTGEAFFKLGDTSITLLDTPGHVDFSTETERTLQVLDLAVLVISALSPVQANTRTLWRLLKEYSIPTFIFVTKCDMGRRTREEVLTILEKELGPCVELSDKEKTAMCDERMLEEYLETSDISETAIRKSISERKIFPTYFGSGLKDEGITEFLTGIEKYLSSAGNNSSSNPMSEKKNDFGGRVFKISYEKENRLTKLKVTSGKLKVRDTICYKGLEEKINEIRIYNGKKYVTVSEVEEGSACSVLGLTETLSGDALGIEKEMKKPLLEPLIRYRILLQEGCDPKKFLPVFKILNEEDPKLNIIYSERLKEFHCSLMGEVQGEIFKGILKERFNLDIEIAEGHVIYKETIVSPVEGVGHYEPLRHYAEVHLFLEPLKRGSGIEIKSALSTDELEGNYQRLVFTHLKEKIHVGVLTGSPITDMRITLVAGKAHEKHTEGGDFRESTYRGLRQGLMKAKSVLLEPYYRFVLDVPVKFMGRAITDIRLKSGTFENPENDGENVRIKGRAPVVTLDGYMKDVVSYTGGLGQLSLEFDGYDVCHNPEEVITSMNYNPEQDLENTPDSVFCEHGAGLHVKWNEVENHMHLPLKKSEEINV